MSKGKNITNNLGFTFEVIRNGKKEEIKSKKMLLPNKNGFNNYKILGDLVERSPFKHKEASNSINFKYSVIGEEEGIVNKSKRIKKDKRISEMIENTHLDKTSNKSVNSDEIYTLLNYYLSESSLNLLIIEGIRFLEMTGPIGVSLYKAAIGNKFKDINYDEEISKVDKEIRGVELEIEKWKGISENLFNNENLFISENLFNNEEEENDREINNEEENDREIILKEEKSIKNSFIAKSFNLKLLLDRVNHKVELYKKKSEGILYKILEEDLIRNYHKDGLLILKYISNDY